MKRSAIGSLIREPVRRASALLALAAAVAVSSAVAFRNMHTAEPIIAGPGVTASLMLSDFVPALRDSPGDTRVFVMEGAEPGGTMLLLGGTHPQEIAGTLTAVLVVENVVVERGRLIVIPQANASGFTYTAPLEAFAHRLTVDTGHGERWFRVGMRLSNPVHQWPDPDLFIHPQSGEGLVGWEARNLNRNFPGTSGGRLTARLANAVTELVRSEHVLVVYDMHEANPESPLANSIVAHQNALELTALTGWGLEERSIRLTMLESPRNLHGLSHRELGDHTSAMAVLSETVNPAKGRFRGALATQLLIDGRDKNYVQAGELGLLYVPFDLEGHPLHQRVARNLATLEELVSAHNSRFQDAPIEISRVPPYDELVAHGLGEFLLPE